MENKCTYQELEEKYHRLLEDYNQLQILLFDARLDNIKKINKKGRRRYIYCEEVLWDIIFYSGQHDNYLAYEAEENEKEIRKRKAECRKAECKEEDEVPF